MPSNVKNKSRQGILCGFNSFPSSDPYRFLPIRMRLRGSRKGEYNCTGSGSQRYDRGLCFGRRTAS